MKRYLPLETCYYSRERRAFIDRSGNEITLRRLYYLFKMRNEVEICDPDLLNVLIDMSDKDRRELLCETIS